MIGLLMLAATGQLAAGDVVRTPDKAIAIGRECAANPALKGRWHAKLHGDTWRVWFSTPSDGDCPAYGTTVSAVTGKTGLCTICAVAD